jgi:hypothetical protein
MWEEEVPVELIVVVLRSTVELAVLAGLTVGRKTCPNDQFGHSHRATAARNMACAAIASAASIEGAANTTGDGDNTAFDVGATVSVGVPGLDVCLVGGATLFPLLSILDSHRVVKPHTTAARAAAASLCPRPALRCGRVRGMVRVRVRVKR